MKTDTLIGLYDDLDNLVGYFHDEEELNEHLSFLAGKKVNTKEWKHRNVNFL